LADWNADQRAKLDIAMQSGVAVLSYTCKGIQVLPDCKLDGSYKFAEIAIKKETLDIDQSSDLSATLPVAMVEISAEIKRGLKLQLAYAMIGRSTQQGDEGEVWKGDLKPDKACEGATHYVRQAWMGAFDFGTATEGSVAGGVKTMGAGAEGSSKSAKKLGRTDGVMGDCKANSGDAPRDNPPGGCNAIVRLVLGPVVQKKPATKADSEPEPTSTTASKPEKVLNTCTQGYVRDSKGQCKLKSAAKSYLCDPKDANECAEQCNKGSAESCHNAARAQFAKGKHASFAEAQEAAIPFYEKGCEGDYYPSCNSYAFSFLSGKTPNRARAKELHQKACKGGEPNSCMALAAGAESAMFSDNPGNFKADHTLAFKYTQQACALGSGYACSALAKRYIEGKGVMQNTDEGLKTLERSCAKRNFSACFEWSQYLVTGKAGATPNPKKGFSIQKDLCEKQNYGVACVAAGEVVRKGVKDVKKEPEQAKRFFDHACNNLNFAQACAALGQMHEQGELGKKDPAAALQLYEKACPRDRRTMGHGCFEAASLYEKGGAGIKKNPQIAATLYSNGCTSFDPEKTGIPEKSCRKAVTLLTAQKGDPTALRNAVSTLCIWHKDKAACAQMKKLAPAPSKGPPPPPPKPGGVSKPPPPPPPPPPKK
jgi:TPR repeat protein